MINDLGIIPFQLKICSDHEKIDENMSNAMLKIPANFFEMIGAQEDYHMLRSTLKDVKQAKSDIDKSIAELKYNMSKLESLHLKAAERWIKIMQARVKYAQDNKKPTN